MKTEDEEDVVDNQEKPSLFPLFPVSDSSSSLSNNNNTTSNNPYQWLSNNTSFTTELSIINQSVSSQCEKLRTEIQEDEGNLNEEEEAKPSFSSSYALLDSASSDSDERRHKKKDKKRKRKRSKEESSVEKSRKSGVRVWAGSDYKPSKDYYIDSRGDVDNLAFGSLYRMDVARYKLSNPGEFSGHRDFYQRRDSLLNGEADADSLDAKLRSSGRYWSSKYSALERHKDFKRMRIVGTAEMPEFSEFIPLAENSDDGSQEKSTILEESWEDEVLRRTKEFNKLSRESPHDEKVWIAFAEFQDKVASKQPHKGARLQILEKKISILEKAIELNPDNEDLLLSLMKAYQRRDSNEVLTKRWEKILMQHSGSYKLWREFLHVLQEDFSRFKVSNMRKMYGHAIQALSSACAKLCRLTAKPSSADPAIIQLELGVVDIFVSLCRLEWQSGYQELATGLFQAEIEYSLFCPSLLLTEQSKQRLFEHFWGGNDARLGEDGALGWSIWLEKEEEKRQQIIKDEETLRENEEGCWTGWSEPQSVINESKQNLENLKDGDLGEDDFEKDFEADTSLQDDDFECLLKKLGIDAETDADTDVKDTATWSKWSQEELVRDGEQWMPSRENSVGAASCEEGDDEIMSTILFEDVREFLFSLCSEEARFSLASQFIEFFGGKMSQWTCTNSPSWIESTLSLETLADSILDDLRCVRQVVTKTQSSSSNSALECLLEYSNDEVKRTNMMKFLRNAILLCLNVFPRNHLLEEAALVAEELFTTKMNSCPLSVTPSRTLAKVLLKNDRQDLLLCGLYARREAAYGNIDLARKVFDMALSSVEGLPLDLRRNVPLLYFWYAEMELANFTSGSGTCSQRAVHILSCFGSGVKYSTYQCQPSQVQLLKAHQGFKEFIRTLRPMWARGNIKDESIALICAAALFEEITTGWAAGIGVIEEAFSMVLPERRGQSLQLESLLNYYIKMMQKYYSQLKLSNVWDSTLQGLQIYPYNSKLFTSLVEIGCLYTVPVKLRRMFDEYCQKRPSVIAWLFAVSYELDKEGSRHRIHALFERALANDKLEHSVILWRCYIAYELDVVCNPSAAKRVFFRAIHACPWSKKLWLDGFLKLNSILTVKELSDLQEVMRDKEIHLRTDIYEILLQDETNA